MGSSTPCGKGRCGRPALLGSRCVYHWIRRRAEYRKLPTHTEWWQEYEKQLVGGLTIRAQVLWDGITPEIVTNLQGSKLRWKPLVEQLIVAADKIIERQRRADSPSNEEAGRDG